MSFATMHNDYLDPDKHRDDGELVDEELADAMILYDTATLILRDVLESVERHVPHHDALNQDLSVARRFLTQADDDVALRPEVVRRIREALDRMKADKPTP